MRIVQLSMQSHTVGMIFQSHVENTCTVSNNTISKQVHRKQQISCTAILKHYRLYLAFLPSSQAKSTWHPNFACPFSFFCRNRINNDRPRSHRRLAVNYHDSILSSHHLIISKVLSLMQAISRALFSPVFFLVLTNKFLNFNKSYHAQN